MRKEEYLHLMRQALAQYDKKYVDEILSDYEEHFQYGMEQGKSEEEICAELGSVEDIVGEIKELTVGGRLTGFEVARPMEQAESERKSELKRIRFSAEIADVRIIPSKDGEFHIYTENKNDMEYLEHHYEGDSYVGRVAKRKGFRFFGTELFLGNLMFLESSVIIEVPAGLEELMVEAVSGDVYGDNFRCGNLQLNSASGDIKLKNVECRNISISTKSGDIKFEKIRSEKVDVNGVSGDIFMNEVITDEFSGHLVSGDVKGKHVEIRTVSLRTVNGDVSMDLECHGEPLYVYTQKVNGDVRIKGGMLVDEEELQMVRMEKKRSVSVNTVNGDILIKRNDAMNRIEQR